MKKLLYTLLAVSIIFSACEKEEEETSNTGNNNTGNNNGTATFLENQDGSVWYLIGAGQPMIFDTIGFYNSTVFCIHKDLSDQECLPIQNGVNYFASWDGSMNEYNVTTLNNNSNSILFEVSLYYEDPGNEGILSKIRYEYIVDGANSIKLIQHWSYVPDNGIGTSEVEYFYTKSTTETNLSCN